MQKLVLPIKWKLFNRLLMDGTSSQSVEPCSTLTVENSQFGDAEISAGDLATTVQLPVDGTSSQPMAGDHEPIDLIPSLLCQGYDPKIEKFYENFPFQLLPTIPHFVLCGSSLHHKSCKDDSFQLQPSPNSSNSINKCCSSLESDIPRV